MELFLSKRNKYIYFIHLELHFGSKNIGKISIIVEDFEKLSLFSNRSETLNIASNFSPIPERQALSVVVDDDDDVDEGERKGDRAPVTPITPLTQSFTMKDL